MKAIFSFAHPDDETFSSGGTIAKLVRAGHTVKLICATRGEAGQVGEPPICKKEDLAKVRTKELENAAGILGISEIIFLGLIDGTLHKIVPSQIEKAVLQILQKEQPDMVITFNKTGGSNHPDHKAIGKATTKVFTKYLESVKKHVKLYHTGMPKSYVRIFEKKGLSYNAFGKVKGVSDKELTTRVNISDTFDIKVKALKCHETQAKDWERFLKRTEQIDMKQEFFQLILENSLI